MSYKFRSVEPTTDIEDAVQKMLNNKIRRLLVIRYKENLVGVYNPNGFNITSYEADLLIEGTVENIAEDD